MLSQVLPTLLAMAALLVLSGFFSGSETALFSLRREHLRALGRHRGRFIRRLLHDPKSLLITILFGNLVVNVLFYSVSVVLVLSLHGGGHDGAATAMGIAAPLLVIVFGEVAPKSLAVHRPRAIAEVVAPPLTLLRAAVWPVRLVLGIFTEGMLRLVGPSRPAEPFVTAHELKQLLEAGQARGTLRPDEGRMLRELVDLGHLRCREVMVPRVEVVMASADDTPAAFIDLVRRTGRKRIPVYEGTMDHVLGTADARYVLAFQPQTLRECIKPIAFVPQSKSVESLLQEFRQTHTASAIVVDEFGGTAGLVTLQDVLEELVGTIGEETAGADGRPMVQRLSPHTYRVVGRLSVRDWNEHPVFSVELARRGTATIGGFVTSLLGRLPVAGDVVTQGNVRFTVERVGRHRIEDLTVEVLPRPRLAGVPAGLRPPTREDGP